MAGRRKRRRGPGTEAGKAAVRLNPVKHGVLSQTPVLPLVERREDWDRLRLQLIEYWEPNGFHEQWLVNELAAAFWRGARNLRFESESSMVNLRDVPRDWWLGRSLQGLPVEEEDDGRPKLTPEAIAEMDRMLALRLLPGEETLSKVMRYETMLHRKASDITQQLILLKGLREPGGGWRLRGAGSGGTGESKRERNFVSGRYVRKEGAVDVGEAPGGGEFGGSAGDGA